MIEKEKIDAIKTQTDIIALIESRGIPLKKQGKSYMGRCPFHDDKTPSLSVTPNENLFQCFGCGAAGDVIRFVELFDRVDFKEAVNRLSGSTYEPRPVKKPPSAPKPDPANARVYFERVIAVYENNFVLNDSGKTYLEGRGITDAGLFARHSAGFCDGSLYEILPTDGDIWDALKQMGILLEDGTERFKNCVVFPVFDAEGEIVTLYGRHIDPASHKKHLFLPGRSTGLWNSAIMKSASEVILTESVIDALSVHMAGYPNAMAINGVNGLSDDDINTLKTSGVRKVVLLMDGDDAGTQATQRLKEKISGQTALMVQVRSLPDGHDPNSYLRAYGPQKLAEFIRAESEEPPEAPDSPETETPSPRMEEGVVISCGIRQYRVMGLDKGPNRLKTTIRIEHAGKLHIDTLDLYNARARTRFAADISRKLEEQAETIEGDIIRIIRECERMDHDPAGATEQKTAPAMSDKEKDAAVLFGRSEDLVKQILDDFRTCGLIGEEANKLLGYIAMTSRKQKEPLSVQILSSSGAGKTALQDAVVGFCPPEDLIKLTSLSGKALFYKEQSSLKHKVLALEEGDGAEDAAYAIRNLISAGVLINETTIKDLATGRLTTMENRVEGPTAVFYTTTNPEVDPETKSRFFVTGIDESREQTRKILAFQREKHLEDDMSRTLKADAVMKKHHTFQRLLEPVGVKNPYSGLLTYGDDRLQGRRDQPKYLNLIKSVAFLRQMQKETRMEGTQSAYIEVDPEDIRIANKLTQEILGRSLDELSRPGRGLLMLLDEMVEQRFGEINREHKDSKEKRTDISFSRRDIREYTGWSNYRVHTHMKELVTLEYVLVDAGKNGSSYRYRLAYEGQGKDGSRFILGLTDPEKLKREADL